MIEVMVVETANLENVHASEVARYMNEGYDIYSNHVNVDGETQVVFYTTFLTRGSRPGQAHKASMIEMQGLEIAALRAEIVALQEAFKHNSARIDVILRDMQGDATDEAVPLAHYQDVTRHLRQPLIKLDDIPVYDSPYAQVIAEALAEDEELGL